MDAVEPPDRTPAQMLAVLHRIVNRQVEALKTVTRNGTVDLDPAWDDYLDTLLARVVKLAQEDRAREPTDDELLDEHDKQNGGSQ